MFAIGWSLRLNPVITIFLLVLLAYGRLRRPALAGYNLLALSFLFVLMLSLSFAIVRAGLPRLYIPVAVAPMLAALLFAQPEIALLMSVAVSLTVASVAGNHFYLAVLFLISSLCASILVFGARRRMTIIRAGFIVGLLQAAALFMVSRSQGTIPAQAFLLKSCLVLFLNGFISGVIVLGVLPLFEYLFGTVTNISLLELADFNHPLLQRLVLEAPGTYHHSLVVGNLSESACRAVAANALLARIGAYYHDIGKLQKPEYFSENQEKESKHDHLAPTMSKLVIMNHVKEGAELAKKYKLNPAIVDFIQQHHGNSLVYYFYRRALESLEDDNGVKEEGFRYPGPKPSSKETAIVLLADSVEAATRALKEPSPAKITELVHKVINNKFIDGQLDECDLTLKDLEKISAVFIRILGGIYHSRISYPEETKNHTRQKA